MAANASEGGPLRVLVVDDSAVVRQGLLLLGRARGFEVDTAADPLIAQSKLARARPDVLVLDLEMPHMDGLTFLRQLMREAPLPVVVCSSRVGPGSEDAVRALEEGAVDLIAKPSLRVADFLRDAGARVEEVLRAAARARVGVRRPRAAPAMAAGAVAGPAAPAAPLLRATTDRVVAVGASTGGTEALAGLLEALPPDAPGLLIVQHMPAGFTRAFAARLDARCRLDVREAAGGEQVREGLALVAPGDRHLRLVRSGGHYRVEVLDGPPVSRHRPSVDVLFHSVARAAGACAAGVILTGMGDDGADGLLAMRRAGATTLGQDEQSCVVYGMSRAARERGAVEHEVALHRLPHALGEWARGRRPGA